MPPVGFEPAVPANVRSQTHAFERAARGICPTPNNFSTSYKLQAGISRYIFTEAPLKVQT